MTTDTESLVLFTKEQLAHLNKTLAHLTPQEIIRWSIVSIPNLYQTTAFGLTGLVILDMISKLDKIEGLPNPDHPVDLIFMDTLHHFPQTLSLVDKVKAKYSKAKLHIYRPIGCDSEEEFAAKYGDMLWETNDDKYDYLVKVEPAQRAYKELQVAAVFTGRRRSQGGARNQLPIIEIEQSTGIIKINPLASWDFKQVHEYVKANDVPYNELLDLGYKSIGDYHSTVPIAEGEDERSGRWKGKVKTECGIHQTERFTHLVVEQVTQ